MRSHILLFSIFVLRQIFELLPAVGRKQSFYLFEDV